MKILCKIFGHKFNLVDKAMLSVMQRDAINKKDFAGETVECKRCHKDFAFPVVGLYENKDEMDLV